MGKNRKKTSLVHIQWGQEFEISRETATGNLYIKNTDTKVQPDQVRRKVKSCNKASYDFSEPEGGALKTDVKFIIQD